MKKKIHPKYENVNISCACGNEIETKSTIGKNDIKIEICSNCHPFYTGKQKLVDTAGRVDKFKERQKVFEMKKAEEKSRTGKKTKKETVEEKMTRKAEEKEALKAAEKEAKDEAKKKAAKKRVEKITVKKEEEK